MRRILRKIAENETENLGDISTLAEPSVVQLIIDNKTDSRRVYWANFWHYFKEVTHEFSLKISTYHYKEYFFVNNEHII